MSEHAVGRFIDEFVQGKPYVFVIMPFKEKYDLYRTIEKVVRDAAGINCFRAEDAKGAGHNLLSKIQNMVDRAEMVIAEISNKSPNVYYEVGYAVGIHKRPLLVAKAGTKIPTDLVGLEVIEYAGDRHGMESFEKNLSENLKQRLNSQVALLRDMLQARSPQPAYILASPKYPGKKSRSIGQVPDQRTFGDNLGVMGLISAFGSFMGEGGGVELVSSQWYPDNLLKLPRSLYLIGSPRVTHATEIMLAKLQRGKEPYWFFDMVPGYKKSEDYEIALYRKQRGKKSIVEGEIKKLGPGKKDVIHNVDHGLILRGPHPKHPDRLVLIMAGSHSLGTGAACLAATRSPLIQQINDALPEGKNIAQKDLTFWVLVRGRISKKDSLLDMADVEVIEAGVYDF